MAGAIPIRTRLDGHRAPVMRLALDSERGLGFSADASGLVRAWRLPSTADTADTAGAAGEEVWRTHEPDACYALALATTGKTDVLVAAGAYERLSVHARDDGRPRTHLALAGVAGTVRDLAVLAGRGWVYAVTQQGMLAAYDLATGNRLLAEATGLGHAYCCAVRAEAAAGSAVIAVGGTDGTLALFQHVAAGLSQFASYSHTSDSILYAAKFLLGTATAGTSGPSLLALGSDGSLLWQGDVDTAPRAIAQSRHQHYALAASPDGRYALVGGEANEITVHRLPEGDAVASLATAGAPIWSLAISGNAQLVAAGDATGAVLHYDLGEIATSAGS